MVFSEVMDRVSAVLEFGEEHRLYEKDIAKALQISPAQYSNAKKRGSVPIEAVTNFCARRKVSINWVLYGQQTGMLDNRTEDALQIIYHKNYRTSAGGGAINEEGDDCTHLTIDPEFQAMLGIKSGDSIEAIRITGDSMEPTLSENSILILDRKKTELINGGIFVVNTQGGVFVKRISLNAKGGIDLISDNTIYPPQTVEGEDVTVVGKVIGALEKI